ncbi:MAG: DUF2007 domain-containing protein [Lachnospiraceae bacterium]|nr:DUF2007 domain-containing protein [Lachnospiraceae bacterium]
MMHSSRIRQKKEQFRLVFTAKDALEAEMVLITLKKAGVPAFRQDLGDAGLLNIYGRDTLYGANIYVAEEKAEEAKEVLAGMGISADL